MSSEEPTDTGDPINGHGPAPSLQDHLQPTLPPPLAPREHIISTAMTFLQNQSVKRNPLSQKQQFLRSKGLTEDEIQIACERAGVFTTDPNSTVINMGISAPKASAMAAKYSLNHPISMGPVQTTFQKIKDVLSSTALFAGIAYAIYLFYKNYIRPFLFGNGGRKKKRKTPEETVEEMSRNVDKNIANINQELGRIKEEVIRTARQDSLHREISNFKSDLDAIKGLLLNRKQFSSPVLPPSIPVWQLQSQQTQVDNDMDKIDDIGSGSGSSETEVVTKNSDSSLEVIP